MGFHTQAWVGFSSASTCTVFLAFHGPVCRGQCKGIRREPLHQDLFPLVFKPPIPLIFYALSFFSPTLSFYLWPLLDPVEVKNPNFYLFSHIFGYCHFYSWLFTFLWYYFHVDMCVRRYQDLESSHLYMYKNRNVSIRIIYHVV